MAKGFFKQTTKLTNNIIVYDLETGGMDPYTTEPLEIAAIVVDMQTLTPKEGGYFGAPQNGKRVLIRPTDWSLVSDEALQKNGIKREELERGLDQESTFKAFCNFCRNFQKKDGKWDAMYPAGFNIKGFDNIIMHRLCMKYDYVGTDKTPKLFHPMHNFDLADICRFWFHDTAEGPQGYSLESIRDYFGVTKSGAHEAMVDVEHTLLILRRMLQFQRKLNLQNIYKFKGAFNETK